MNESQRILILWPFKHTDCAFRYKYWANFRCFWPGARFEELHILFTSLGYQLQFIKFDRTLTVEQRLAMIGNGTADTLYTQAYITLDRMQTYRMSTVAKTTKLVAVLSNRDDETDIISKVIELFNAFSPLVWLFLIVSLCLTRFVSAISTCQHNKRLNHTKHLSIVKPLRALTLIIFLIRTMTEETHSKYNNLEQIVQSGMKLIADPKDGWLTGVLAPEMSNTNIYRIMKLLTKPDRLLDASHTSSQEEHDLVRAGKAFWISRQMNAAKKLRKECGMKLVPMPEMPTSVMGVLFARNRSLDFMNRLNSQIHRLYPAFQSFHQRYKDRDRLLRERNCPPLPFPRPLHLHDFTGIFLILVLCFVIGNLVLVVEFWFHKCFKSASQSN